MIVKSERIAATLLTVVALGTTNSVWGQASKPAPTAKPALMPAELMLLNGFYREYSLEDGELVKHFAPPFHPGRVVYDRQTQRPSQKCASTDEPDSFFFHWQENKLDCVSGAVFGVGGLPDLIPKLLDFDRHEIEGDEELLKVPIRGDWILREGVPDEQILAGMEKILRDQLQLPVKISVQELARRVFVARGDFRFTPMGDSKHIQIYGKTLDEKGGGGGSGDLDAFLRGVGRFIGQRVTTDAHTRYPPDTPLRWRYRGRISHDKVSQEDIEAVLKHVTEQTGLTLAAGVSGVRVLMVERMP